MTRRDSQPDGTNVGSGCASQARPALRREVGQSAFFMLAFGSMIGVGWVTALGSWLDQAGPLGALIAFAVGGTMMLAIGCCYAEATSMLPLAGGEVAYSYRAFGVTKAFLVGWCLAFGYISISGFEAISIGKVLGFMIPSLDRWAVYTVSGDPVYGSHLLLALLGTTAITFVHYRGVRAAATLQKWLTMAFIGVTLIFVVVGLVRGSLSHLSPWLPTEGNGAAWRGIVLVLVTVPFWFVGFDTIPQAAEEAGVDVAPRQLAGLILGSIVAAVLFYMLLILSVGMIVPWPEIVGSELPAARAFEAAFESRLLVYVILTAALLGLFTSWNGFFLAGSRVLFALGRGGIIPESLGATHPRFGTPHRAVLWTGLLTLLAPLLGRGALLSLVNVGSFCIGLAFLGVAFSILRLRRIAPALDRPFRVPGGSIIPGVAVMGSLGILVVMVIPFSPAALSWPREMILLLVFVLAGVGFWVGGRRARSVISESRRAYLILERFANDAPVNMQSNDGQTKEVS